MVRELMGFLDLHREAAMIKERWRITALAGAAVLTFVLAACSESEETPPPEESPSPAAATATARPTSPPGPHTATPTPLPAPTPGPAGVLPAVRTLRMEGPAEAHPGEKVTYELVFDVEAEGLVTVRVIWSPISSLEYGSSRMLEGIGELIIEPAPGRPDLAWAFKGAGAVELVFTVAEDHPPGSFVVGCYQPGTGVQSCENVETVVSGG
jgi:hypothetical protein